LAAARAFICSAEGSVTPLVGEAIAGTLIGDDKSSPDTTLRLLGLANFTLNSSL
jgi:hypothetical protein